MRVSVFFLFLLLLCAPAQAQRKSFYSLKEMAEYFTHCLAAGEFDSLLTITPPASVMRILNTPNSSAVTDPEQDNALSSWPGIRAGYEIIIAEARARNINLAALRVTSVSSEPMPVSPKLAFITTAIFDAAGVEGEFTLVTVNHNRKWYLMEIMRAEEVFK